MTKTPREVARDVDVLLAAGSEPLSRAAVKTPSYRLLYLSAGRRSMSPEEFLSVEDAIRAVNFFKARGFTAWVEDDTGKFVPVKGARRKPLAVEEAGHATKPARVKRPPFKPGDSVTLSPIKKPIPAYGGKPFIGREDILRVSSVVGTGSKRNPYGVVVTDGVHFWHLEPDDVTEA